MDPARAVWEAQIMFLYGLCAGKHVHTVDAWPKPSVDID